MNPFNPLLEPIEYFDWLRANELNEDPIYFLTGQAGTGKTFSVKKAIEKDPQIAILTATTGIAAVNLGGAVTIHSLLKVFNEESLAHSVTKGYAQRILRDLPFRLLIIDEAGMMNDRFMVALYNAVDEVNREERELGRLGVVIVGDFAQLPLFLMIKKTAKGKRSLQENSKPKRKKKFRGCLVMQRLDEFSNSPDILLN